MDLTKHGENDNLTFYPQKQVALLPGRWKLAKMTKMAGVTHAKPPLPKTPPRKETRKENPDPGPDARPHSDGKSLMNVGFVMP